MRKRINLFSKTAGKNKTVIVAQKTVFYATRIGILLFVVFLALSGFTIYQKMKIQSLLSKKQELLNFVVQNKNSEIETTYFLLKRDQLKKFLKDDAEFLPYYTILRNSFNTSSTESANIESMIIDKSKKTQFTIRFNDYNAMYAFIKYIESDTFLKYFETLTLTNFTLGNGGAGQSKGYELNFEGKFKPLIEKSS